MLLGECSVECKPRARAASELLQPWEAREPGEDPWCCTLSLQLASLGAAAGPGTDGSEAGREDLDLDGLSTRRTLVLSPPFVLRNQLAGPMRYVLVDKSSGLQLAGQLPRDTERHWHAVSPRAEVELTVQLQGYTSPNVALIKGVDLKGTVDRNWAGEERARRLVHQARASRP